MSNTYGSRGLKAIAHARADRAAGRFRSTATAGVVAGCAIIGALVLNSVLGSRSLAHDKASLLSKQRALQVTVGPQWNTLQTIISGQVARLGAPEYPGDFVDSDSHGWNFGSELGLYLRIPDLALAGKPVLELTAESKIDALATCLVNGRASVHRGDDGGMVQREPVVNAGDLYSRLNVLTDGWVEKVNSAPGDLELRSFRFQFEEQEHREIPQVVDILQRAGFLLVAIDEPSSGGAQGGDVAPFTRVSVYDLKANRERLRMRARGEATIFGVGDHTSAGLSVQASAQRQANSCALAAQVVSRLKGPASPSR